MKKFILLLSLVCMACVFAGCTLVYDEGLTGSESVSESESITDSDSLSGSDSVSDSDIKDTFTVAFETNGGSKVDSIEWEEGVALSPEEPVYESHRFMGWYYDEGYQNAVDFSAFTTAEDITLYAKWIAYYNIRLYKSEYEYTQLTYDEGEEVNISEWEQPTTIHEGETIPLLKWVDETLENDLTGNFIMPSKSLAFYAVYDMPQLFGWSYDKEMDEYTAVRKGIRTVKDVECGDTGTLSCDLTVTNANSSGVGLIWNATVGESDYPFDYADGSTYWYLHHNPKVGTFHIALVNDTWNSLKSVSAIANTSDKWYEKWNNWRQNGGEYTVNLKVKFTATYVKIYVDNDIIATYVGDKIGTLTGTGIGLRTNDFGSVVTNITYKSAVEVEDGDATYKWTYNRDNGSYTSNGVSLLEVGEGTKNGTFSSKITVKNKSTNSIGLIFNADLGKVDNPYNNVAHMYFCINPQNGALYLYYYNGSGSVTNTFASVTIAKNTTSWKEKWTNWSAEKSEDLVFTAKVEFTATKIACYIDDELQINHTTAANIKIFNAIKFTSVGFKTNYANNIVSDISFTPLPRAFKWTEKNGVYTSTGASLYFIEGGAKYGEYSADFEVKNASTSSIGLIWNADEGTENYPYNNVEHMYLCLNATNGRIDLMYYNGSGKSTYTLLTVLIADAPENWKNKWNAWNDGGKTTSLDFNFKAVFTSTEVSIYIDGESLGTYSGEHMATVNAISHTALGLKTNYAKNVVKNVTFLPQE